MKILLTGATGFIGKRVYQNLISDGAHSVFGVSRRPVMDKQYQLDILNKKSVDSFIEANRFDVLIHLAWDVTHGEFWDSSLNEDYLEASKHLCEAFLQHGGSKIIAAGTCAEYPALPYPVREDVEYEGELTPYGQSKKALFKHLVRSQQEHTFDLAWLRIFGIYGEGEDDKRFFPIAKRTVLEGQTLVIETPHIFADYIPVDAVAGVFVKCLKAGNIGDVNIGTGVSMPMCDWYAKIKAEMTQTEFQPSVGIKAAPESRIPDCRRMLSLISIQ